MNNTDLEEFLYVLSNEKIHPVEFFDGSLEHDEKNRKFNLLLTFMNSSYAATVWDAILKKDDITTGKILENLMSLYPLSQFLVLYILRNSEQMEELLLRGLDVKGKIYEQLKFLLDKMRNESGEDKLTKKFENYENTINSLGQRMIELEENNAKALDYKKKKKELEDKIAILEKEADESNRQKTLDELERRINEKKREKAQFERDYGKKKKEYEELSKELIAEKDKIENKEEERLIESLIKLFPKDEGGDLR